MAVTIRAMLMQSPLRSPAEPWEIRCFLKESGRNEAEKWHLALNKRMQVRLRTHLNHLRFQPEQRWTRPDAAALGDHLCVIHFKDENRTQHRLTGYFDIKNHAFVICVYGFEKDGVYTPQDYADKTRQCREDVGNDFQQRTAVWPWRIY